MNFNRINNGLHCLIYEDEKTGNFCVSGIEIFIVVSGKTVQDAVAAFESSLVGCISLALEADLMPFGHVGGAPNDIIEDWHYADEIDRIYYSPDEMLKFVIKAIEGIWGKE